MKDLELGPDPPNTNSFPRTFDIVIPALGGGGDPIGFIIDHVVDARMITSNYHFFFFLKE